ncbi:MAG: hypothetical protein QM796_13100 [Chthoniobacteraceae bacterium]
MMRVIRLLVCGVCFLAGGKIFAQTSSVALQYSATVTDVQDSNNLLQGQVYVGEVLTGTYVFATPATNKSVRPGVGTFDFTTSSSSCSLQAGSLIFGSDPSSPFLRLEVLKHVSDGTSSKRNSLVIHSYNNQALSSGVPVDDISWQIDDFQNQASISTSMPTDAPNLSNYSSVFGLTISGALPDDPAQSYLIKAKVTSISKQ